MKTKYLALIVLFLAFNNLHAQTLKGTVVENGGKRLQNVFVKDGNSKAITLTDKKGNFEIPTQSGHVLVFTSPGYVSDTLYVTDLRPKEIKLVVQSFTLNEVNITSTRAPFNPRVEYADVYQKSKVYPLSPSSWLSKEGRNARRLKHYFDNEEKERAVDAAFSRVYVSTLVPLKGRELADFMVMYRPTYEYVKNNNGPSIAVYVNDSYKKYMALPPEKRIVPRLGEEVK